MVRVKTQSQEVNKQNILLSERLKMKHFVFRATRPLRNATHAIHRNGVQHQVFITPSITTMGFSCVSFTDGAKSILGENFCL